MTSVRESVQNAENAEKESQAIMAAWERWVNIVVSKEFSRDELRAIFMYTYRFDKYINYQYRGEAYPERMVREHMTSLQEKDCQTVFDRHSEIDRTLFEKEYRIDPKKVAKQARHYMAWQANDEHLAWKEKQSDKTRWIRNDFRIYSTHTCPMLLRTSMRNKHKYLDAIKTTIVPHIVFTLWNVAGRMAAIQWPVHLPRRVYRGLRLPLDSVPNQTDTDVGFTSWSYDIDSAIQFAMGSGVDEIEGGSAGPTDLRTIMPVILQMDLPVTVPIILTDIMSMQEEKEIVVPPCGLTRRLKHMYDTKQLYWNSFIDKSGKLVGRNEQKIAFRVWVYDVDNFQNELVLPLTGENEMLQYLKRAVIHTETETSHKKNVYQRRNFNRLRMQRY